MRGGGWWRNEKRKETFFGVHKSLAILRSLSGVGLARLIFLGSLSTRGLEYFKDFKVGIYINTSCGKYQEIERPPSRAAARMPFSTTVATKFGATLLVCQRQHTLIVALNRPRVRNAFNDDMYSDLVHVLYQATHDDSVAAVVLTGCGPYFSSGADLNHTVSSMMASSTEKQPYGRQSSYLPAGRFMRALLLFPKVLAVAVNGPAVGIAVTLLFHCDLVVCSPNSSFWVPFTRLALVPEFCSSKTFVQTMGMAKTNELLLLGRKIDAPTAVNWNICSRILTNSQDNDVVDPFAPNSVASQLTQELERLLFALPHGPLTSRYFVELIRKSRRLEMESVCQEELIQLDERFNKGHVKDAVSHIQIGSRRSKL